MANQYVSSTSCSRKSKVGGDQAFSYNIDERLEKVSGHFRKDFEGLVSAESLGSKFGGYGSFFPVDEKSKGKEKEKVSTSTSKKRPQTKWKSSRKRKVDDVMVEAAFSYNIDERIEKVLGHFRRNFEGLGSKFGGYGSFLPVDQRSIGKEKEEEKENVFASTLKKKLQTTCSRKRKVGDVVVITSNRKRKDGDIGVLAEGTGIIAKHSKALKSVSSDKGNARTRLELVGEKKIMKPVLKVVNSHSKKEGSSTTVKSRSAGKQEAAKFGSKEAHSDRFTRMFKRWQLRRRL
ncbi:hypothetical protein F0562_020418 [Nyssa sinensis]|uniref:Uncharacterized protein n=1 Tax=Nyssa sinensis TaxID=561372 RepID=A0A5J5BSF8_9ASTE|nr:hypothetical protein F0562_020418 [Nyssa sinensis]